MKLTLGLLLLALPLLVNAQTIYRCVDKSGKTTYQDNPCDGAAQPRTDRTQAQEKEANIGNDFNGALVSVNYQSVALGAALETIGNFAKVDLRVDDSIRDRPISIMAKEVPWNRVVQELANRYGLRITRSGSTYYFTSR